MWLEERNSRILNVICTFSERLFIQRDQIRGLNSDGQNLERYFEQKN